MKKEIKKLTDQLIGELERLQNQFQKNEKIENNAQYFAYVKEETTPTFKRLDEWYEKTMFAIEKGELKVHPSLIMSTKENVEAFIMHSYYYDVRKRRYMEIFRSCMYVFNNVLKEIDDES